MRLLSHLLTIRDLEVLHAWPKQFQYVVFVSKCKQDALMKPLFHLNHGYACSSSRRLNMPSWRYTTPASLMFDSWYRWDNFVRHTRTPTMQPHCFRYQRELAILLRDHSVFVSLYDKHCIKVGEPGFPVAAVERGRRVLVSRDTIFEFRVMILPLWALYLLSALSLTFLNWSSCLSTLGKPFLRHHLHLDMLLNFRILWMSSFANEANHVYIYRWWTGS